MLGWRLAMSALLIPAFAVLCWLDHRLGQPAPVLYALCCALGVRATWELVSLLRPRFPELQFAPVAVAVLALLTGAFAPHWSGLPDSIATRDAVVAIAAVWVLVVQTLFAIEAWRYRTPGARMETLSAGIMAVSYIGCLLAVTAQLRWVRGSEAGYYVLASMVIATKMGDVGAYTLGRLFGRRKMAPHLSPGKTWAGFFGALLGGGLGGGLWLTFGGALFEGVDSPPSMPWSIAYGVVLGFVGLIGDLCESLIKRDMGQKDAAALMPGFGGLLDLIDSILFAGPVAWLCWSTLPR